MAAVTSIVHDLQMLTWKPASTNASQAARDIVSAATWIHSTFAKEVWLWRGQARSEFGIEPSMHTRVLDSSLPRTDATVAAATKNLLSLARSRGLDRSGNFNLPDLALLATLQHHGAATPLLDVTTDPLIALWMAVNANRDEPDALDDKPGKLFGILRPPRENWIDPLDSRAVNEVLGGQFENGGITSYGWYRAPDVTERLRIQRGSFLMGPLKQDPLRGDTSMMIEIADERWNKDGKNFIERRLEKRGNPSNITHRRGEAFAVVINGAVKRELRTLLADRSGLDTRTIYPTPWNKPFIDQFSEAYGRKRPLEWDLATAPV